MSKRRTYDAEFKRNAVMLIEQTGRSVSDVSKDLGIGVDLLHRWRRELKTSGQIAFPGRGIPGLTEDQRKIRELEKQLRDAELERDILKKHWPSSAKHRNEISDHS